MLSLGLIHNEAQRTLQPPLVSDGDFNGCSNCELMRLGQDDIVTQTEAEKSRIARERAYAVTAFVLGLTGVGVGAYVGAKTSRQWAAGGAVVGMAAAGIISLILKAALLPERIK